MNVALLFHVRSRDMLGGECPVPRDREATEPAMHAQCPGPAVPSVLGPLSQALLSWLHWWLPPGCPWALCTGVYGSTWTSAALRPASASESHCPGPGVRSHGSSSLPDSGPDWCLITLSLSQQGLSSCSLKEEES